MSNLIEHKLQLIQQEFYVNALIAKVRNLNIKERLRTTKNETALEVIATNMDV